MAGLEVTARPNAVGLAEARLQKVREWMARQVAEGILPGLSVAVARRGEIAFAAHAGAMDVEAAKPLGEDTIFRIYSMTKPIVCAAAMMLYEEGRFQLDDPIADFMPEFGDMQVALADGSGGVDYVAAKRPISVRDLMRHTSGLGYAETAGPPFRAVPTRANTLIENFVELVQFSALPSADFEVERYNIMPAPVTRAVDEGDVIDLGDRHFSVMHLPGHSPGSIALWEEASGLLFSGDILYDGELYDFLHHSSIPDYLESLARLREQPVATVHAGHYDSFGRERMKALIDDYAAGKRRPGCPAEHPSPEAH